MPNNFYYFMYERYNLKLSLLEIEEIRQEVNKIKIKDDDKQKD